MAEGRGSEYAIRVRVGTKDPQEITINTTWTVRELKRHIVNNLDVTSGQVDLIFSGKSIDDDAKLEVRIV